MSGSAASSAGWEYKGKHKDLDTAFDQILRYRNALENPPLLVLCDLDRIVVRTNFTGTVSDVHEIPLEALAEPRNIEIMRAVFHNPKALIPGRTSVAVTRKPPPEWQRLPPPCANAASTAPSPACWTASFLPRKDSALLPDMIFADAGKTGADHAVQQSLTSLFEAMAWQRFRSRPSATSTAASSTTPSPASPDDIKRLAAVSSLDWAPSIPSIFGTLFERGL